MNCDVIWIENIFKRIQNCALIQKHNIGLMHSIIWYKYSSLKKHNDNHFMNDEFWSELSLLAMYILLQLNVWYTMLQHPFLKHPVWIDSWIILLFKQYTLNFTAKPKNFGLIIVIVTGTNKQIFHVKQMIKSVLKG
jgi:hypothetical protein